MKLNYIEVKVVLILRIKIFFYKPTNTKSWTKDLPKQLIHYAFNCVIQWSSKITYLKKQKPIKNGIHLPTYDLDRE